MKNCKLCHDSCEFQYCDFCKSLTGRDARLHVKYKKTTLAVHLCKISKNHGKSLSSKAAVSADNSYPRPYCAPEVTRRLSGLRRRHETFGHRKEDLLSEEELCAKLGNTGITACWYCGDVLRTGLDRVENSLGYSNQNSVACCYRCNFLKANHSVSLFLEKIGKVTCSES